MTANSTDAQKLWGWLAGDGGDGSRSGLIRQAPNDAGPAVYGDWLFSEASGGSNADLTGATTLTFIASATMQGGASLAGSSALTFATDGDLTGTDPATDITGATSFAFATAGSLIGNAPATGSTSVTFAPAGAMTGSANISGAANLTFAPSGNLAGAGVLSGASTVTFAPAGSLVTFAALSGASSFAFITGGILNGAAIIGGASFPTFTLFGGMATGAAVTGATAYQFTPAGELSAANAAVIRRGDDGGSRRGQVTREWFWRKQAEEWFEERYGAIKAATTTRAKRRLATRITADVPEFVSELPELAPRVNALETIAARMASPAPDYGAIAAQIEWQIALIEAWKTKERKRRDMEAILVLSL